MTCYYCARTSGHEAECPTGGVYAKRDAKIPAGIPTGIAMLAFRGWSPDWDFGAPKVVSSSMDRLAEKMRAELTVTGTQSLTLAAPERKAVILSGDEFDGAEWKPVDLSSIACKCQACIRFYSR